MNNIFIRKCRGVHHLTRQRGASLLEGIAYLGIAAIVILGAVSLLTGAFSNAQANRAVEEVISLRTAVRKLYSGQTYPAAMAATMITARAIPGTLAVNPAAGTLTNAWGGAVTLAGAGGTFTITYAAVPEDVCINMISGANGWTQIQGGGVATLTTFPVTAGQAASTCAAGANAITFTSS